MKIRLSRPFVIAIFLFTLVSTATAAESSAPPATGKKTVPLWEVQLFVAGFHLPHYRGSKEYETYVVPVPYLEYRGDFLRINKDGVKGIFFRSEYFETDLSAYGNPPVGDGSDARQGMEELDPLVELGPALKWYPKGRLPGMRFYGKAAVRGVLSVDFPGSLKTDYQGIHGEISLVYADQALWGRSHWHSKVTLGTDWTDRDYNAYLYDVPERHVLPDRPAFRSGGGYGGVFLSGHLTRILTDRFSVSGYARWENCTGTAFKDSPLVETDNNFSLGAMVIWTPLRSKKQVDELYSE
ncbi:MAG: MipA/OmpV family protein [Desulfobacteraceae bacterium]|nr:MipA/OmpV family protein [Desulfobacteraceae bacterium]